MAITFNSPQDPNGLNGIADPLIAALQQRTQQNRQKQQNIAQGGILNNVLSNLGNDASAIDMVRALTQAQSQGLSPENVKQYLPAIEHIGKAQESNRLKQEKANLPLQTALGTLQDMKALVPKLGFGNLGLSPEGRGVRQQYETYKTSLLAILNSIPVRNKAEFEQAKKALASPWSTQQEIEKGIEAAERIIQRKMGEGQINPEQAKTSERSQNEPTVNIREKRTGRIKAVPKSFHEQNPITEGFEIVG